MRTRRVQRRLHQRGRRSGGRGRRAAEPRALVVGRGTEATRALRCAQGERRARGHSPGARRRGDAARKVLEGLLAAPLVQAKGAYDAGQALRGARRRCARLRRAAAPSERAVAVALRAPRARRRPWSAASRTRRGAAVCGHRRAATATGVAVAVTERRGSALSPWAAQRFWARRRSPRPARPPLFFGSDLELPVLDSRLRTSRRSRAHGLRDRACIAPKPEASGLTVAVCVAGSMRDPTDYAAAYGADPPRTRPSSGSSAACCSKGRFVAGRGTGPGALSWSARRRSERNPTSPPVGRRSSSGREAGRQKERRNGRPVLDAPRPRRALGAAPPPGGADAALDETVAREAADARKPPSRERARPTVVHRCGATLPLCAGRCASSGRGRGCCRRTSRALGDGDEEAARRRNAADAERLGRRLDDDETDEESETPESPTTIGGRRRQRRRAVVAAAWPPARRS